MNIEEVFEQAEEIKRLKEEYIILQNASDEVEEEKDREIERLNTNLKVANEDLTRIAQLLNLEEGCTIYDVEDKIERLNNIINELEKYCKEMAHIEENELIAMNDFEEVYIDVLDKIKELKGSDKE